LEGGDLTPPRTRDPWDFFNWHRPYIGSDAFGTAFPSFHFTMYFAVARVMRLEFDNVWIPYAMGVLPLLYEIDNHGHWVSDMVAGAALGTLIGSVVSDNYHGRTSGNRMSFGVAPFHGSWAGVVRVRL
jgi:hypothetical protein